MAYQVLSRKWRPVKFQDVVGQSHITRSLVNALKLNKLGHAYLFTGTRGIGKTTVARIFAKALRCESLLDDGNPCGQCPSCKDFETGSSMNVYEIDGASNNSVDDIRDLISNVQYLPTSGKYKVYIIDEVHMLSTSAFNALLKTLEEPPEHVVFLFATTEPHKLLETVLSRCQRFDFKNATQKEIVFLLEKIAKEENIKFESPLALEQLAGQGKGSFRDTLSLLDQVLSFSLDGDITDETLANALGLAMQSETKKLLEAILNGSDGVLSSQLHSMLNKNVSLENILRSLQDHLFRVINNIDNVEKCSELIDQDLVKEFTMPELLWVYETFAKDFVWALASLTPENAAELVLKKVCFRRDFFQNSAEKITLGKKKTEIEVAPVAEESDVEVPEASQPEVVVEQELVEEEPSTVEAPVEQEEVSVVEEKEEVIAGPRSYSGFLEYVNRISPATASNLEQGNIVGEPEFIEGDSVVLTITFAQASKVFYDFLHEPEVAAKVRTYLAKYYELPVESSQLQLTLLEDEDSSEDFVSVADIRRQEAEQVLKNKEENIRNNPMLREAERIFASKVDKVVLNEE